MKKLVIPGGSGFLGSSFRRFAEARGWNAIVLSRSPREQHEIQWDAKTIGEWADHLVGADAVVNLVGRSVNCLHNDENNREILESRVNAISILNEAIAGIPKEARPKVMVQAASLAIYGNTNELCDENSPHGDGFMAEVYKIVEREFLGKEITGVRKCLLRIGFALGPNGGALQPMRNLTRSFLGGTIGSGKQFLSWIHVEDLHRMILRCIEDESLEGTFNATGPDPVTNREFMKKLRRAMGRPWSPPIPSLVIRTGARFVLHTEANLILQGRKCIPKRFQDAGFDFRHTDLDATLRTILEEWGEGEQAGKR